MVRIIVVDDHKLVRKCLCARLDAVEEFEVIAEADSGEQVRELTRTLEFDVLLMDLNMPGIGGLEAARRLLLSRPETRIIGISMYVEGPFPAKFMELGGAGYVSKNADAQEMIHAIREVHAGRCYISHDVAQIIAANRVFRASGMPFDALTPREIQVLHLISEGQTVAEIALALNVSRKTIAHHRRRLFEKFGVGNDVQLALIARSQGFAEMGELMSVAD
ncbi:MAG: response regulator [Gammaproteobacteria bacterium]|nr:response regulator [Gammaproteobacteria bacterium]